MPGRSPRQKGNRIERELVNLHRALSIHCERVPLSGAAGGTFGGDLRVAERYTAEVKARAAGQGFATIERWLGQNDLLFLRRDRAHPLVVMPFEVYIHILQQPAVISCPQ